METGRDDSRRLKLCWRLRFPLALATSAIDGGSRRLHRLALQAGGRRFDPGTLHWKKRRKCAYREAPETNAIPIEASLERYWNGQDDDERL